MLKDLYAPEEVSSMILGGDILLLAGDTDLLSRLPKGNWIGACTTRFVVYPERDVETSEKIFVTKLPDFVTGTTIREYDANTIKGVFKDSPKNGFTVLVVPFGSPVAIEYSTNAVYYENFAVHPVCGCMSGDPTAPEKMVAVSGIGPDIHPNKIVAMHVSLPESKYAEIHTINPFKQGNGDSIVFDYSGLILEDAYINGKKRNFAEYLNEIEYDALHLPFVANYSGEIVSLIGNKIEGDKVLMVSPVFENIEYRIAALNDSIPEPIIANEKVFFSVSCIANYSNPEIRARFLKQMNGPIVFGEIAYQLVGYTTVYLTINDVLNEKQ